MELDIEELLLKHRKVDGDFEINDHNFENEVFSNFDIRPKLPLQGKVILRNLTFKECSIQNSGFLIGAGVSLENVLFQDLNSQTEIMISTNAHLQNVIFKGKYKGDVSIKPSEDGLFDQSLYDEIIKNREKSIDRILDISNLEAKSIEIYGIPLNKVKINTQLHVRVKVEWEHLPIWEELDEDGFFVDAICDLKFIEVNEAIINFPSKKSAEYKLAIQEYSFLKKNGLIEEYENE